MQGAIKYGCWLDISLDGSGEEDEDDDTIWSFKVMGTLTDVQAVIGRAALDLKDDQTLNIRIESFHADE